MSEEIKPVMQESVRSLCFRPYYNHPKGCPNWNKRSTCPPQALVLTAVLKFSKPIFCIYNRFDLREHVERIREAHSNWTDHQLYCCLYWQPKARKQLRIKVEGLLKLYPDYISLYCPEANGVNVTKTMQNIGIELEWPVKTIAYQVALVGVPINRRKPRE